jgi:MFS family permease
VNLRGLALDLGPVRSSKQFRYLLLGQAFVFVARQFTVVAIPYQVFLLTGSSLAVGLTGLAQLVPLVITSLYSGAVVDSRDRRQVLLAAQALMAATIAVLLATSLRGHPPLWILYLTAGASGVAIALDRPARQSSIPRLLSRAQVPAAMSMQQVVFQAALVAGPIAAGAALATTGAATAYGVALALALAGVATGWAMAPLPPAAVGPRVDWKAPVAGLAYVRRNHLLLSIFAADLDAMVFGMPRALFPAIALNHFGVGAAGLGVLYAGPGIGALVGSLLSGWVARVSYQGRLVLVSIAVWGLAVTLFGLVPWYWVAVVLLAVAGAADMLSAVFRNTINQLSVPDAFRGRVSSLDTMVVQGGPALGDLEAGAVAAVTSVEFSVVSGGLACIAGIVLLGVTFPALRRYRHAADGGAAPSVPDELIVE